MQGLRRADLTSQAREDRRDWSSRSFRHAGYGALAGLCVLLPTAACEDSGKQADGTVAVSAAAGIPVRLEPFHEGLHRAKLDSARIVQFSTTRLGRTSSEIPLRPSDISVGPNDIVAVDLPSQSILRYDREGRFLSRYTHVGQIRLVQPLSVARLGDSSFVLDITGPVRVSRLGSKGVLDVVDSGVPHAIDFAIRNGTIYYGRTMAEPADEWKGLVQARSPLRESRWEACPSNPTLVESVKRKGAIGVHQLTRVAVFGNTVYCAQPSSPSIQMYDLNGTYRGRFDRVPPNYRSASDQPMTAAGNRELQATWMPIEHMWPWATGVAIRYIVLDTIADLYRNFMFVCDSAQGPARCTHNEIPFRVLSFSPPDTAWALDNSDKRGPRLVGIRIVRHKP